MSLGGRYLAPGLIAVHTHLPVVYPLSATDENENPGLTVMRAYGRAQDALRAGITTIRCVHELNRADLLLAEAARAGWADVPRIVGAGRAIGAPGGHGEGHAGLHPQLALAGATSNAARLLGMESEIGTIEEGRVVDFVAVEENPISDVAAMREISFVMQSGRVVRDGRPAA